MLRLCRDCLAEMASEPERCPACGSGRMLAHAGLDELAIGHVDCDAFYAAIEKRDNPALEGHPVIVGGSQRGVVLTACYVARRYGVRSAMPMFEARRRCPHAVVVRPRMAVYGDVAREIRAMLLKTTPLVEPRSLDEAYLDLSGTVRLHDASPAATLARLAGEIETTIGITVSIGLSYNKFLAKLASDMDKPRGFAVIGRAEAAALLREKPIAVIHGVGPALQTRLARDGYTRIAQLQDAGAEALSRSYGKTGLWLHRLSLGKDERAVEPHGAAKSISSETTFARDIAALPELERVLWNQAERVSARAKSSGLGGRTVTLKLTTAKFRPIMRSVSLEHPTQLSDVIFRVGRILLAREATGIRYRLLGVGLSNICPAVECDPRDLLNGAAQRRAAVERAMDNVRAKFGTVAIRKGRGIPQV